MINVDIHADDYGYSLNTSKDILDCLKTGKLDSISIICNTMWFEESMELLYETIPVLPYLPSMSIHLNLPEGNNESELLPMSWGELFLSSYGFHRNSVKKELKKELKRQIDLCQQAIDRCIEIAGINHIDVIQRGIRLDSHVHTHLIPIVWESLCEVIEEEKYDVEYIRNPKEPIMPFIKELSLWKTYGISNMIKNRILMLYSGKVDRYCEKHKIGKMYMWGLMMSGHMDIGRIEKIYPDMLKIAQNSNRKLEILFHPGKAEREEFGKEMNPDYFKDFNSTENRHIEKDAVLRFRSMAGEDHGK